MAVTEAVPSTLILLRNDDVDAVRPCRLTVPLSVDTIAELCAYISKALPPENDPMGRGYRFLYSIIGKPLWRVNECLEARVVVVSIGPGFMSRKAALPSTVDAMDITPQKQLVGYSEQSMSPPVHTPEGYGKVPSDPSTSHGNDEGATADSEAAVRGVSITMPALADAWRHHQNVPYGAETRYDTAADSPAAEKTFPPHMGSERHERSLSRDPLRHLPPPPPSSSAAATHSNANAYDEWIYPSSRLRMNGVSYTTPAAAASVRGQVRINGQAVRLPSMPMYQPCDLREEILEDDSSFLAGLRTYTTRKWTAFRALQRMNPAEQLGTACVRETLSRILQGCRTLSSSERGGTQRPCRVVVSGPPLSGVSTTTAQFLSEALPQFGRGGAFQGHCLVILDLDMLVGGERLGTAVGASEKLQDMVCLFQVVMRATLDAIAAQRPALRTAAHLLAELWDKVVGGAHAAPNFLQYSQVASLVGHKVLQDWNQLAAAAFPILQAAKSSLCRTDIRDAALDLVFYSLPATLAASLRFTGVVFALDSLHGLYGAGHSRIERPLGDLTPVLKALWSDPHVHVFLSWPSATPSHGALYLQGPTEYIQTVGLVKHIPGSTDALDYAFPTAIVCQGRSYPLSTFLGCPGYLAVLAALVRSAKPSVHVPLFSAYSVSRRKVEEEEDYKVCIDLREAGEAMEQLHRLAVRVAQ